MPLGQQHGTHRLGTLVVRGSVFVRISIPPAGPSPPAPPVPVGAGPAHLVRGEGARSPATHVPADAELLLSPEEEKVGRD